MNEPLEKRVGLVRASARKILDQFFAAHPPIRIPVPVKEIAESFGFEVYELGSLGPHQRAILQVIPTDNRKLIGLNSRYHRHNQRFSIGHELGHYFMEHPAEDQCVEEEIAVCNREADEFSAELLMPLGMLRCKITELRDPMKIAAAFDVSQEALWRKIMAQKLVSLL